MHHKKITDFFNDSSWSLIIKYVSLVYRILEGVGIDVIIIVTMGIYYLVIERVFVIFNALTINSKTKSLRNDMYNLFLEQPD